MGNKAQIIGAYDTSKNEYGYLLKVLLKKKWLNFSEVASEENIGTSQDTYNPGDVVNYALSSDEQEELW